MNDELFSSIYNGVTFLQMVLFSLMILSVTFREESQEKIRVKSILQGGCIVLAAFFVLIASRYLWTAFAVFVNSRAEHLDGVAQQMLFTAATAVNAVLNCIPTAIVSVIEEFDESKCSVSTWLYVIASNRLKNYYRGRKEELPLEAADLQAVSEEKSPQNMMELEEMRRELLDALKMLPLKERSILIQKFYMGKSAAEIAEDLGLTPGNVRVIQKRSLEKLRKILEVNGR